MKRRWTRARAGKSVRSIGSQAARRRGVTAVEVSIVIPIFLLSICATIELSRIVMLRNLGEDASYVAARACMVEGATAEEATAKANSVLSIVGTRGAKVVINDGAGLSQQSDSIKVTIDVPLSQNSWVLPWIFSGKSIQSYSLLRTERYDGYYQQ